MVSEGMILQLRLNITYVHQTCEDARTYLLMSSLLASFHLLSKYMPVRVYKQEYVTLKRATLSLTSRYCYTVL